eukprot:m.4873 g.4873  ORF g.4873 m.4873 type:complete len:173 (-) comp4683_c0_seq2:1436-1954(-)
MELITTTTPTTTTTTAATSAPQRLPTLHHTADSEAIATEVADFHPQCYKIPSSPTISLHHPPMSKPRKERSSVTDDLGCSDTHKLYQHVTSSWTPRMKFRSSSSSSNAPSSTSQPSSSQQRLVRDAVGRVKVQLVEVARDSAEFKDIQRHFSSAPQLSISRVVSCQLLHSQA